VAEASQLQTAENGAFPQGNAPARLEGVPDGLDAHTLANGKEWPSDAFQNVCVFVGVDVGDLNACMLETLDLSLGFARDVGLGDFADQDSKEEVG
jgi:hypothetical protein